MDITKMMLLRSCTRGTRQLGTINSFIENGMTLKYKIQYDEMLEKNTWSIAEAGLQYKSWVNLRKRLIEVGFTVHTDRKTKTITIGRGIH